MLDAELIMLEQEKHLPESRKGVCQTGWLRETGLTVREGGRVKMCQQQKYRCTLSSWSVPQNIVNLKINQIPYVPCFRDSGILSMA